MTTKNPQRAVWELVRVQHGVVSRGQLSELGFGRAAIRHRVERGRLHRVWPGVFAVGRPALNPEGRWMAAVLTCGPGAVLSHQSAAELWGIRRVQSGEIHVSVPRDGRCPDRRPGIRVHRRERLESVVRDGISVSTPAETLIDLAATLKPRQLEAAVNEADKHDLIDPETLRNALDSVVRRPGTAALRRTLDRHTYTRTDSELERRFVKLALEAGLPRPETQQEVNGFRVDFHWPDLELVVETDGLRYHRTPAQQAEDRRRDQTHTAAGLTVLRFTHGQVVHDGERVREVLRRAACP